MNTVIKYKDRTEKQQIINDQARLGNRKINEDADRNMTFETHIEEAAPVKTTMTSGDFINRLANQHGVEIV